jgi:hypothetical protein
MKQILTILLVTGLVGGVAAAQDVAALIEKLKSKNSEEAEGAQDDLLKTGGAAAPLREAAMKSEDAAFKKRASSVADRLETRKAAAGLGAAWGDRWYAIYINSLKTGWVHLKAEEKDGKIVLTDELFLQPGKDQTMTVKTTLTCEPNEYLSPLTVSVNTVGGDNAVSFEGKVKEGRMIVTSQGEKQARRLNSNTVVDFAFMRLVTILPCTPEYPLSMIELMKPEIKDGVIAKFEKEETIEHEGKKVKARRFILSDGVGEDKFYWVGAAGQLYKLQAKENVEAVLSDEKRAKDLDTKE